MQFKKTGLNYVSAWLKASFRHRAPALPVASLPDLKQAAGPVPHYLQSQSTLSLCLNTQPVFFFLTGIILTLQR